MGGTGVALARDGAAPFLNPAAIVRIRDQDLAFSTHLYTFELTHFSGWHEPGAVDSRFGSGNVNQTGVTANHLSGLPSTACLFFTIAGVLQQADPKKGEPTPWEGGRQQMSFCIGTVESNNVGMPALALHQGFAAGVTSQSQSASLQFNRAQIGPSYSAQVNDRLAFGVSLLGSYTTASFVLDSSALTSGADGSAVQSDLGMAGNGRSFDLTAIVGATYLVGETLLGLSVQIPSLHLFGSYTTTLHEADSFTGTNDAVLAVGSGSYRALPPLRVAFGVGRTWGPLTAEVDAFFTYSPGDVEQTNLSINTATSTNGAYTSSSSSASYSTPSRPSVSLAAGAEYLVSSGFSFVGGVSANFTTLSPIDPAPTPSLANLVQARSSAATAAFGIGSYGSAGSLMVGLQLGYGWGEALAANPYALPNEWAVVDTQDYSALLVLAGSTNLRVVKRAAESVENAIKNGVSPGKPEPPVAPTNPPESPSTQQEISPAPAAKPGPGAPTPSPAAPPAQPEPKRESDAGPSP